MAALLAVAMSAVGSLSSEGSGEHPYRAYAPQLAGDSSGGAPAEICPDLDEFTYGDALSGAPSSVSADVVRLDGDEDRFHVLQGIGVWG